MKIKTITFLVIALSCFFAPATSDAVMSIRSLGGAGTFNGTDAAKSVAQENVARIGAMRIGDTTGGRGASARSASTSRLAIGKYLGGTSSVSGSAAVVKPVDPEQSGVTEVSKDIKDLQNRVGKLEGFVEDGKTIAETLQEQATELVSANDVINTEMQNINNRLESLEDGVDAFIANDDAMNAAMQNINNRLESLEDGVDVFITNDDAMNAAMQNINNRLEKLEDGVEASLANDDEIKQIIAQTQAGLQSTDATVNAISNTMTDLQERLSVLAGRQVDVKYENGVLTLTQSGQEPQQYNLLQDVMSQLGDYVDTDKNAMQDLQGRYTISGELIVPTPALPPME